MLLTPAPIPTPLMIIAGYIFFVTIVAAIILIAGLLLWKPKHKKPMTGQDLTNLTEKEVENRRDKSGRNQ